MRRYVYFPIGSALNTLVALFVVFTFVALWHDLTFQLLAWGWVITLFVLPEYIAMRILPEAKYGDRPWYRHACAVGGIFNVLLMITGNTVGFVLGPENTLAFLKAVFGTLQGKKYLSRVVKANGARCRCPLPRHNLHNFVLCSTHHDGV